MTGLPAWYGEPAPGQHHRLSQLAALPAGEPFTTALRRPGLTRSVSAVLATYNRSPFNPRSRLADNPLYWAVTSLRRQAGNALAEIIVVDDGSADHTPAVLRHLARQHHPVPLRIIRLNTHAGAWQARNTGARASQCRWLYYSDDDCVAAPHAVSGAAHVLAEVTRRDDRAAAVSTACYYRTLRPAAVLPRERIGMLRTATAEFATGFHAMPAGYLAPDPPVAGPAGVLAPLPVSLIGGTALIDRDALARAGGFADLSHWHSGYADHLHLSADLTGTGARLYHCPDPRLSAVHLKFGAAGQYPPARHDTAEIVPSLGRPLAEFIALSSVPRTRTGPPPARRSVPPRADRIVLRLLRQPIRLRGPGLGTSVLARVRPGRYRAHPRRPRSPLTARPDHRLACRPGQRRRVPGRAVAPATFPAPRQQPASRDHQCMRPASDYPVVNARSTSARCPVHHQSKAVADMNR